MNDIRFWHLEWSSNNLSPMNSTLKWEEMNAVCSNYKSAMVGCTLLFFHRRSDTWPLHSIVKSLPRAVELSSCGSKT